MSVMRSFAEEMPVLGPRHVAEHESWPFDEGEAAPRSRTKQRSARGTEGQGLRDQLLIWLFEIHHLDNI